MGLSRDFDPITQPHERGLGGSRDGEAVYSNTFLDFSYKYVKALFELVSAPENWM